MKLSAPKVVTFYVSVALIIFGLLAYFTEVISVEADTAVLALAAGAVLLTLSTMLKDL